MLRSYSKYETYVCKDRASGALLTSAEYHFEREMLSHTFKFFRKEKETSAYGKEREAIFGRHQALTTCPCSRASGNGPNLPVEDFLCVCLLCED